MFGKNESDVDRIIRAVVGLLLATASFMYLSGWLQIVAYVLAVILLFTAITGFCLIYKLFGIGTLKQKSV